MKYRADHIGSDAAWGRDPGYVSGFVAVGKRKDDRLYLTGTRDARQECQVKLWLLHVIDGTYLSLLFAGREWEIIGCFVLET